MPSRRIPHGKDEVQHGPTRRGCAVLFEDAGTVAECRLHRWEVV